MGQKTLIIIDMLNDFLDPQGSLFGGEAARAIIPFVRDRLDVFRSSKDLVVYLQDTHAADDKEFERFPSHCVEGTWGGEIIPELTPLPQEPVIPKRRFSGFFETDLESVLRDKKLDEVEVVGVCTSICVMDTVGGLVNRDYRVAVPKKGVADINPDFHRFALDRMEQVYGVRLT
ncbi:MAG: nicotinamidase [Deltaproteobacteria bacterium CG1_02_45_11]|nr:MAG: nicotinamidase [Deltaproteobacteria bacterium CG1_02_45_11]